jgi:hypothetical protein
MVEGCNSLEWLDSLQTFELKAPFMLFVKLVVPSLQLHYRLLVGLELLVGLFEVGFTDTFRFANCLQY